MPPYRDPSAARHLGRLLQESLNRSKRSANTLVSELGLRSVSKLESLLAGKHYFQLETAMPLARVLDIDNREMSELMLLQYHPETEVAALFELLDQTTPRPKNGDKEERRGKGRKKKKRKK